MTMHKIAPAGVLLCSAVLGLVLISASGKSTAASAAPHFRGGGDGHCLPVGGTVMTNFINADTTLGTASGDLRGAVSASLLGAPQPGPGGSVVFHVQHHWVTETGDTLAIDPAIATTAPLSQTLFAVVTYPLHISGGSGRFTGATGDITNIGEVDLSKNATVFRYTGRVCFEEKD
jgi:hypothetical protein